MATVYIADDSLVTRTILSTLMKAVGHQVIGMADNGRDALTAVKQNPPDILLLDMLMPMMDGVQVAENLKALKLPVRIVMISSVSYHERILAAREAGIDFFILKPFEADKVIEAISKCLARPLSMVGSV